jgi:hypothetical protein
MKFGLTYFKKVEISTPNELCERTMRAQFIRVGVFLKMPFFPSPLTVAIAGRQTQF